MCALCALAALLTLACDDDGNTPDEPGADTTQDTGTDTAPDSANPTDTSDATDSAPSDLDVGDTDVAPDTVDTHAPDMVDMDADTDPVDVTPDPSLEGTTLHDVGVRWDRPLHLCTPWSEGHNFEGDRFEVELPVQTRAGLGQMVLGGASLEGPLLVATGAYQAERRWLTEPTVSTAMTAWQLQDPTGDTRLEATLEHTIESVGVLTETYDVRRSAQDMGRPVDPSDGAEVRFVWAPAGGATPLPLEPCAGRADAETAVYVTAAHHPDGRQISVLRLSREWVALAGSAPVWVQGHAVLRSDAPWQVTTALGPWTHRYRAAHHNWDDRTEAWFDRDVANDAVWYDTNAQPAEPVVAGVRYLGLGGYDAPGASLELDWLHPDHTRTTETWDPGALLRVDATQLARGQQTACDGQPPEVFAVWGALHLMQLMTCPDATQPGGFALLEAVPVAFPGEVDAVGQAAGRGGLDTLEDGTPAHLLTVGEHTVRVAGSSLGDLWMQLEVRDAAGEVVAAELTPVISLPELWARAPAPIVGEADGVTVELRRVVAPGPAVGNSSFFAPERLTVQIEGEAPIVVDALDAMSYQNSHHNHGDILTATTAEGLTIDWQITDTGASQTLRITRADGTELLPTTTLATRQ